MTGVTKRVRFAKRVAFDPVSSGSSRKGHSNAAPLRSVLKSSNKINVQNSEQSTDGADSCMSAKHQLLGKQTVKSQHRHNSADVKRVAQLVVSGSSKRTVHIALDRPLLLAAPGDRPIEVHDEKHATIRLYAHLSDADHLLVSCQNISPVGFHWNSRQVMDSVLLTDGDSLQLSGVSGAELIFTQLWQGEHASPVEVNRDVEMPAQVADRYILTSRVLGTGSYGTVRLAWDKDRSIQVACKVQVKDEGAGVEAFLHHSQREYSLLRRMELHPNINGFLDFHEDDDSIYHLLEIVTGGDLFGHLQRHGPFKETQGKAVVYQLLLATEFLHTNGIAHRDIKPENILLKNPATTTNETAGYDGAPHVQLADFGLSCEPSKILDSHLSPGHALTPCGTVAYHSPEFLLSAVTRQGYCPFALDIWTLGCVSYKMLFDVHPFDTSPPLYQANIIYYMQEYLVAKGHLSKEALAKRGLVQTQPVEDEKDVEMVSVKEDFIRRLCRGVEWDEVRRNFGVGVRGGVSHQAIPFLASLLCTDAAQRCTASEAFFSQWITSDLEALSQWYNDRILKRRNIQGTLPRPRRQSKTKATPILDLIEEQEPYVSEDDMQSERATNGNANADAKAVDEEAGNFRFDADYSYENDPILEQTFESAIRPRAVRKTLRQQCYGVRRKPRSIKSRLLTGGLL